MDGSSDPFPELAGMTDRDKCPNEKIGKVTEPGNDGETSTPDRPQQTCHNAASDRFAERKWQVGSERTGVLR